MPFPFQITTLNCRYRWPHGRNVNSNLVSMTPPLWFPASEICCYFFCLALLLDLQACHHPSLAVTCYCKGMEPSSLGCDRMACQLMWLSKLIKETYAPFGIKGLQNSYWERERFFSYSTDRAVNTRNSNRALIVEHKRSRNPDVTLYIRQNAWPGNHSSGKSFQKHSFIQCLPFSD